MGDIRVPEATISRIFNAALDKMEYLTRHERDVLTNRRALPLLGELFSARCSQHAPTSPAMLACEKTILRELYWERAKELLAENDRLEIRPRVGLMPLGVPWPAGPSLSGLQIRPTLIHRYLVMIRNSLSAAALPFAS